MASPHKGSAETLTLPGTFPVSPGPSVVEERQSLRSRWMEYELERRRVEYVDKVRIPVRIGTWNVNGKLPDKADKDLREWLCPKNEQGVPIKEDDDWEGGERRDLPALYVVALQEADLSTEAYLRTDDTIANSWATAILSTIGDSSSYTKIAQRQLVGIMLFVFAHASIVPVLSGVETGSVACGIMGMIGNKGAVGIKLRVWDTSLVFIGSHLAAQTNMVDRRNADFHEICKRLMFDRGGDGIFEDTDHVFWCGDLNYRIDLPAQTARSFLLSEAPIERRLLLPYDQLRHEMNANRAFPVDDGWKEGEVTFEPTFKYDVGTRDILDSSEKSRVPSWCDRVLWWSRRDHERGEQTGDVEVRSYESFMDYTMSDHKPVAATFSLSVESVDQQKKEMIEAALEILANSAENVKGEAKVETVGDDDIEVEEIGVGECVERKIVLKNMGRKVVGWQVVLVREASGHESVREDPSWLEVLPREGIIPLKHSEKDLDTDHPTTDIKAVVDLRDPDVVARINAAPGRERGLRAHIVLRLETEDADGQEGERKEEDRFITVRASVRPTCFAQPLEILGMEHKNAEDLCEKRSLKESSEEDVTTAYSLPLELWRLTDWFVKNKDWTAAPDMLVQRPDNDDHEAEQRIIRAIDAGDDVAPDEDPRVIISVLLKFLAAVPGGVIPHTMYSQVITYGANSKEEAHRIVDDLSIPNAMVFLYITGFIKELVSAMSQDGKRNPDYAREELARVFGDVLVVGEKWEVRQDAAEARRRKEFLMWFLEG
ncbi:hypothetical protein YB2330_000380 [Saitoella coloradoensis]